MIEYENLRDLNKNFEAEFVQSFNDLLQSGHFILGKKVEAFETSFSKYLGLNHCVGVASGLDALLLSLKAFNFPSNSEVIVPSNTYIATILAIIQAGLKPVLVEPDIETYNINPDLIEAKVSKSTVAIIIVHLYGKSCEMDKILQVCSKYDLKLIEDCAQSHGAKYKNEFTGTFGHLSAFSFYPTKNLGALGDAGAIAGNDDSLIVQLRKLRNYGSDKKYYNEVFGFNSRLDEIQAGFLEIKLNYLDRINNHKRALAEVYFKNLKTDFIKPKVQKDFYDVYHIFNVRHERRDDLREFLLKRGIKTEIHYPVPPHKQIAYKTLFEGESFPISDEIHATTLSLPISFIHTEEQILKVTEALNSF